MNDKLILGTVQLGLDYGINNPIGKPDEMESLAILELAYSEGIKILDTASAYGNAMDIIGKFHELRSSKYEVIFKFKISEETSNERFEGFFLNSLKRMGVDHFYCYMFHQHKELKNSSRICELLNGFKEKKLLRYTGVSIYSLEEFEDSINDQRIDVIQVPFNLLDNESQKGQLLSNAKFRNKIIHARSVFLQGLFFMNLENLPPKLKPLKKYMKKIKHLSIIYKESVGSMALNYVLLNHQIDGLIFGVENILQLMHNLRDVKNGLAPELIRKINEIKVKETSLLSPINWK